MMHNNVLLRNASTGRAGFYWSMLCGRDKRQRRTDRLFATMETTVGPMRRGYFPFWTGASAFSTHVAQVIVS